MGDFFEFTKCSNVKFCKFCRVAVLNDKNIITSHVSSEKHLNAFVNNSNLANDFNITITINDSLISIEGSTGELFCTKCYTSLKIGNKNKHVKNAKSHLSSEISDCLDSLILQSRGVYVWHDFEKREMLCKTCDKLFQCDSGSRLRAHRNGKTHKKITETRISTSSLESQIGRRSWVFTEKLNRFEVESGQIQIHK